MRGFPPIPSDFKSALMLYGCAYDGENDCQYVRRAGLEDVIVVDLDKEAIDRMAPQYPHSWSFRCMNVADFPVMVGRFDLIVADPYGGDDMDECHATYLPMLHRMMPKMLVVGGYTDRPAPGVGHLLAEQFVRNPNYCWWVWR